MTAAEFCLWLQGVIDVAEVPTVGMDDRVTGLIKKRLNSVFIHEIDPSHSDDHKVQGALQAVHDGLDVNALREELERLQSLDPNELEKRVCALENDAAVGVADGSVVLSNQAIEKINEEIRATQVIATRPFHNPVPPTGPGGIIYMC